MAKSFESKQGELTISFTGPSFKAGMNIDDAIESLKIYKNMIVKASQFVDINSEIDLTLHRVENGSSIFSIIYNIISDAQTTMYIITDLTDGFDLIKNWNNIALGNEEFSKISEIAQNFVKDTMELSNCIDSLRKLVSILKNDNDKIEFKNGKNKIFTMAVSGI